MAAYRLKAETHCRRIEPIELMEGKTLADIISSQNSEMKT